MPLCSGTTSTPNVLVIMADDLGYNDISWHNSEIISPNLDKLSKEGIILENHYVSMCSATRAALLTGYYPIHTGMQHSVVENQEPRGLYTNFTLMSEYFSYLGYRTHIIGKWHLGFCHDDYLPLRRGFDSFYGFYLGGESYYEHNDPATVYKSEKEKLFGYDFRDQDDVDRSGVGTYSTTLFAKRAVDIINDHVENHSNESIFMYLPFQSVHPPLSVPKEYYDLYPNMKHGNRRIVSGMVSAMDDAIGMIVEELNTTGLLDNTIILFASDNGGEAFLGGNNYPLRGMKNTLWEGGTKSVSFIYSKMLKNKGTTNDELIHVSDWLPTLLTAVRNSLPSNEQSKVQQFLSEEWDGLDQWGMLMGNEANKRSEILYNIDPVYLDHIDELNGLSSLGHGAIRIGNFKLMLGNPGSNDYHYPPHYPEDLIEMFDKTIISNDTLESIAPFTYKEMPTYLFDLKNDPNEHYNIAKYNLDVVEEILQRYKEYESTMIPPFTADEIEEGNPIHFNGIWSSGWCKSGPGLKE